MILPEQQPLFNSKHLNHNLFSDYYLNTLVPETDEWKDDVLFFEAMRVRDQLRALLAALQPEALDEAQLEEQWVKPVLQVLGHHWSVQVKVRYRDRGYRKPDYVFTASAAEAAAFTGEIYDPADIRHALAVGDAKAWGTRLDQAAVGGRNPSQQIDEYLRYTELPWGILTDGRYWRLYERSTSQYNRYYAVDLPALLRETVNQAEDQAFFYFYLFFRREGFVKDGWLERILRGSIEYAEGLSDNLEDEVFTALELIAQGFLRYRRNRLTPADLPLIYEQSLIFLYRLLFIAYAESRDILPVSDNRRYYAFQSLQAIMRRIPAHQLSDESVRLAVDVDRVYRELSALFFAIDSGSPEYDLPPYNGRLFSEDAHPFLAEKSIGDAFIMPALDRIARVDAAVSGGNTVKRVNVDYRSLSVRHLGAIYEKLLEYELDLATEPLTLKDNKYAPAGADDVVIKHPGEVYLRTGSNERKITGSYYTPDYIVSFIARGTLEPLLVEVTRRHADLDPDGRWQVRDADGLRRAVLALNILDPATGSGHFLVEVVTQVANWLRELNLQPADLPAGEDELIYWQRQVVTNCIYGIDVNPLAVELAKLSLWLATLGRGKPLSFLDHHLRVGNSLVGANARQIGLHLENGGADSPALTDETAFRAGVGAAVGMMTTIETNRAATIAEVKAQERAYADLRERLTVWRRLADVWTARHFGLTLTADNWTAVYRHLVQGEAADDATRALLEHAERIAAGQRFFHFELAFPEVFFQPDGTPLPDPGFDAVVGNPPYVRQERIQPLKPYLGTYYEVYSGTADLFLYFYERGLRLLKPSQRLGYITSGTFMNSHSAAEFRRYIHARAGFEQVVNFGENQPFRGAEMVYPTIAILKRDYRGETFRSLFIEDSLPRAALEDAIRAPMTPVAADVTALDEWRFQSVELTNLFKKIMGGRQPLGQAVDGRLYRGITTGLNEAFIIDGATRQRLIDEHPSSADIIKPMLRGQDLRPWYQENNDLHMIFAYQGIDIEAYPAIEKHLERFRKQLEPKPQDWNERSQGSWKGRAAGSYKWYELQTPIAYRHIFDEAKIVWADISKLPRFSLNESSYMLNTGFMVGSNSYSLLSLLQSRVNWFAISQIAQPLRLRAGLWQYRVIIQFVERLPIPELSAAQESQLGEFAEAITELARQRYGLHEDTRHRIRADLSGGSKLNEKLTEWWTLDFAAFNEECRKAFKRPIPVRERSAWESYLREMQTEHARLTDAMIALERRLNDVVYAAFDLTPDERALIETATKYPYGSV